MIYLEPGCVDMANVIQDYSDFTLKLDLFLQQNLNVQFWKQSSSTC